MFFQEQKIKVFILGERNCTGQYLHEKSWPFAEGESETMELHRRARTGRAECQLVQCILNNVFVCSTDSVFSMFYPLLQLPLMQINPSSACFQSTNLLYTSSLQFIYLGELSSNAASVEFLHFTGNGHIISTCLQVWFR